MADIRPFRGIRYDNAKAGLGRTLCPPYDAIAPEEAKRLRRDPANAIHLELPAGEGQARYRNSARLWRDWRRSGLLARDAVEAFYVCEQTYEIEGRRLKRLGFLAAMGVTPAAAKAVIQHEKTLSKPRADRLKLLKAVRANVSPIFGIFPDPGARARRVLADTARSLPAAQGRAANGVAYRFWVLSAPDKVRALAGALKSTRILIADGHHRYNVSRDFYAQTRKPEMSSVLIYLCPEEDEGLVVLPTHRVVNNPFVAARVANLCRVKAAPSLKAMLARVKASRNPYAFGLYEAGKYFCAEPKSGAGCRSGLCVEWIGKELLHDVPPADIGYTPDARRAQHMARRLKGTAVFVKSFAVPQVRKAAAKVGLLPQKSTYFYPKIATGLVFKPLE